MSTLFGFLGYWAVIGVSVVGAMTVFETLLGMARGREYLLWLTKNSSGRPVGWKAIAFAVAIWPVVLVLWASAARNRRTCTEEVIRLTEAMDARDARRKAERAAQKEANWPPVSWRWRSARTEGGNMFWYRGLLYPDGKRAATHIVVRSGRGYLCWRKMHLAQLDLPVRHFRGWGAFGKARRFCEGDTEWSDLFAPSRLGDKLRFWSDCRARLLATLDDEP